MTSRRRQPRRTPTPPVALSGALTLDEAAALLADLEGPDALRDFRSTAEYNQRLSRLPAPYLAQPLHRPGPMRNTPPSLGIFWAVLGPDGRTRLLAHPCALIDAERYGDCLTSPAGHHETWEAWRRGQPKPPLALLAPIIARGEYEIWPRGRIVYEQTPDQFVIYADRQLLTPAWLAQIKAHFQLPLERTIARSDVHYSRTRAVGPP
jgi:hypothetical protein